jgi:hypothetical protein
MVRTASQGLAVAELELERIDEARHHLYQQAFAIEGKRARRDLPLSRYVDWRDRPTAADMLAVIQQHLGTKLSLRHREQLEKLEPQYQQRAAAEHYQTKMKEPTCTEHLLAIEWLIPRLRRLDRYSRRAHAQHRRAMEIWRLAHL